VLVADFGKTYRDTQAVRELSFHVNAGEILGLVGPNGAGKTTTLRALSGIFPPSSGRLFVGGHDMVVDPVAAKGALAYVPDDPRLFDTLTVWEHLRFTAAAYRVPAFEPAAETLLRELELEPKRDAPALELSRGMRQKLAIAMAYLHEPRVILLDEPLTGLDPRGIRRMKDSLRERAAGGTAIIVSSHLLALVEDLCTHLLVLHHGERLFFGAVAEARAALAGEDGELSLEEVFFRVTEAGRPGATAGGGGRPGGGSGERGRSGGSAGGREVVG
jgi:ABC-2 type transport system ATP-binding protein